MKAVVLLIPEQCPATGLFHGVCIVQPIAFEEDVDGLDGHDLENVVRPRENQLKLELDQRSDQVKVLIDFQPRELGEDLQACLPFPLTETIAVILDFLTQGMSHLGVESPLNLTHAERDGNNNPRAWFERPRLTDFSQLVLWDRHALRMNSQGMPVNHGVETRSLGRKKVKSGDDKKSTPEDNSDEGKPKKRKLLNLHTFAEVTRFKFKEVYARQGGKYYSVIDIANQDLKLQREFLKDAEILECILSEGEGFFYECALVKTDCYDSFIKVAGWVPCGDTYLEELDLAAGLAGPVWAGGAVATANSSSNWTMPWVRMSFFWWLRSKYSGMVASAAQMVWDTLGVELERSTWKG
eukprot:maker-scaffold861_size87375-snap-gene-0.19 protein:Tk02188 transcript:maker-scaffold861_size87375-snap-gene-0.19-mRNA-1 annotation:"lipoate-protein ligase a"